MTTLLEGHLRITLPRGARARKFDDSTHGLLHRHMKAVDFVIEMDDRMLYLEVKDPEHPKARTEQSADFIARFLAADKDDELIRKFRDSLLYEWACEEVHKPIYYWVIAAGRAGASVTAPGGGPRRPSPQARVRRPSSPATLPGRAVRPRVQRGRGDPGDGVFRTNRAGRRRVPPRHPPRRARWRTWAQFRRS